MFAALKGAATLKARSEYRNKSSGVASVLPIEDNHEVQIDFNLEKSRSTLAKGVLLKVESPNGKITSTSNHKPLKYQSNLYFLSLKKVFFFSGKYKKRSISIIQNSDTKV